jgi:hypothetical protein
VRVVVAILSRARLRPLLLTLRLRSFLLLWAFGWSSLLRSWRVGSLLLPGAELILLALLTLRPVLHWRSLSYQWMRSRLVGAGLRARRLIRSVDGPIGLLRSSRLRFRAARPRH